MSRTIEPAAAPVPEQRDAGVRTVVVGGGCAGLALAVAAVGTGLDLTVLEARDGDEDDRTWCSWDVGAALLPEAVSASWTRWEIRTPEGTTTAEDPAHPYRMVRAADYRAAARARIGANGPVRLRHGVRADPVAEAVPGVRVVDARGPGPLGELRPGRVRLHQRFLGQWIRTTRPVFDVTTVTLMDFPAGPADEVRFVYVLPLTPWTALVESTVFSASAHGPQRFRERIAAYMGQRWGLADGEWAVESEETGSIPMTDQPAADPDARGLRGGVARPSTGYAFARIQRDARTAVAAWAAGEPAPRLRDPLRIRLLDAVFLRFLRDQPHRAPAVFLRMFQALPGPLTVRFLTERSTPIDDLRLILALPKAPFLRAALTTAIERARGLRR